MRPQLTSLSLASAFLILGALCSTVESQQANPARDDPQTVSSKAQKSARAASIDFKEADSTGLGRAVSLVA